MDRSSSGAFCFDSLIRNAAREAIEIAGKRSTSGCRSKLWESRPSRAIRETIKPISVRAPIQSALSLSERLSSILMYREVRSS